MKKILILAAVAALSGAAAHATPRADRAVDHARVAAVGDDSTCKIGCWASNVPSSTDGDGTDGAAALRSLGLAPQTDRLA
ncbi:MAG TPA: hypothetical protein VHS58_10350 [Acetobacteraceae bacterium]|jgi:hypothetical protein|nr:hypothetical protein [Acetobacteraceae bacterium]